MELMHKIDRLHVQYPYYGARRLSYCLCQTGEVISRKRVRRLLVTMGLRAVYQEPRTSIPNPAHKHYPYLLRNLTIDKANQVWASDITYIPMPRGFFYLVAILDWYSRKVLTWKLSNTLDQEFCQEALEEALELYGRPEIFNTDQGSQFSSREFTGILETSGVRVSMDGKGRWSDNVLIERLWRSLKYECVYMHAFTCGSEARREIGSWLDHYNTNRPHLSFGGLTPDAVYYKSMDAQAARAVEKAITSGSNTFPQPSNSSEDNTTRDE